MSSEFQRKIFKDCGTVAIASSFDKRGSFIKPLHPSIFPAGIEPFTVRESFISQSSRGVLRGFHFQVPPHDQWKLVCCVSGEVLDVVLELRRGTKDYARTESAILKGPGSGGAVQGMLIPPGVAHAFYTLSETAVLAYYVSCEYQPQHDRGILWSSAGFSWPTDSPILSDRDRSFEPLSAFESPFRVSGEE